MAVLPIGISGEEGGYQIERSLRFNSADSTSLSRTPGSASNRKTWTWSGWVKRCEISDTERVFFSAGADANNFTALEWINSKLYLQNYTSAVQTITNTTAVFRDASAWYHIVLAIDTTQATSANRAKIYVNGVQQDGFSGSPFSLNQEFWINYTYSHRIGARQLSSADAFSSQYLTEVNFIDGYALDPTSFGETDSTTGVWKPKAYAGSYGTNGFYLNFSDNSGTTSTTLGKDYSGNSNNWTPNNFSVTAGAGNDSLVDTPTLYGTDTGAGGEVGGNYATLNPLAKNSSAILSNGNLDQTTVDNSNWRASLGTLGVSSGKWYWEMTTAASNANNIFCGIAGSTIPYATNSLQDEFSTLNTHGSLIFCDDGKYQLDGNARTTYSSSLTSSQVLGVALDMDSSSLTFYKNGTSQGAIDFSSSAMASKTVCPLFISIYSTSTYTFNFGQRPFAYAAPSGFKALCTTNLPDPAIADGSTAMNVVTYDGTGSSGNSQTVGFQPDLVWLKRRSAASSHMLHDAVRGVTKRLRSDTTEAEDTGTSLSSFDTTGFTLGDGGANTNASGSTYVAWNWKAGGSGVSNTDGSITSTVSANPTAGFSIVTYTGNGTAGATVGHGLGVAPSLMIGKSRDSALNWSVYHKSVGATGKLTLNTTDAFSTDSSSYNNTAPTSTVFTLGTGTRINTSGDVNIAYCFAPVESYSAFGSYTGNGSTDGPFVYTGFRPAYILMKRTDSTGNWILLDNRRYEYNSAVSPRELYANLSDAEADSNAADILSNGFKLRVTFGSYNASGGTYVYACFAENPFKVSLAR